MRVNGTDSFRTEGRKSSSSYTSISFPSCGPGVVGASWAAPRVLPISRITCLGSNAPNEYFCLSTFLSAGGFKVCFFFFHIKTPNPFFNHCAD